MGPGNLKIKRFRLITLSESDVKGIWELAYLKGYRDGFGEHIEGRKYAPESNMLPGIISKLFEYPKEEEE